MHSTDTCAACRAALKTDAKFCGKCGTPREGTPHARDAVEIEDAPEPISTCPNCGRNAAAPAGRFCRACGHRLRTSAPGVGSPGTADASFGTVPTAGLTAEPPPQTQVLSRSRTSAIALAFGVFALTLAAGVTGYWLAREPAVATRALPAPQTSLSAQDGQERVAETARAEVPQDRWNAEASSASAEYPAAEAAPVPPTAVETAGARADRASGPAEHGASLREATPQRPAQRPPATSRDAVAATPRPFDEAARMALMNDAAGSSITALPEAAPDPQPDSPPRGRTASQAEASLGAARTIDQLFQQRVAAECDSGLLGFVCREKVRFGLCRDRWTPSEQPGMTACRVLARHGPARDQ